MEHLPGWKEEGTIKESRKQLVVMEMFFILIVVVVSK